MGICTFFVTLKQRIMARKACGNAADCIFGSLWRSLPDNLSRLSGGLLIIYAKAFVSKPHQSPLPILLAGHFTRKLLIVFRKPTGSGNRFKLCVRVSVRFQFVPVCRDYCGSNLGKRSRKWKSNTNRRRRWRQDTNGGHIIGRTEGGGGSDGSRELSQLRFRLGQNLGKVFAPHSVVGNLLI